jgi:hypothetical protein
LGIKLKKVTTNAHGQEIKQQQVQLTYDEEAPVLTKSIIQRIDQKMHGESVLCEISKKMLPNRKQ